MNSLCKHLIGDQTVGEVWDHGVETSGDGQRLVDDQGEMHLTDWVTFTAPAEQTMAIMLRPSRIYHLLSRSMFCSDDSVGSQLTELARRQGKAPSIDRLCFNHQNPVERAKPRYCYSAQETGPGKTTTMLMQRSNRFCPT